MKKEELLANATNDHDRELMRRDLDKFHRTHDKATLSMTAAVLFTVLGIIGLSLGEDRSILFFIPVFPLIFVAMYYNLKSTGLF